MRELIKLAFIWLGLIKSDDQPDIIRPAEARLASVFEAALPRALDEALEHSEIGANRERAAVRPASLRRLVRLRVDEVRSVVVHELETVASLKKQLKEAESGVIASEQKVESALRQLVTVATLVVGLIVWFKLLRLEGSWRGRITELPEKPTPQQTNLWWKQLGESVVFVTTNRFPDRLNPTQSVILYLGSLSVALVILPYSAGRLLAPVIAYLPNKWMRRKRERTASIADLRDEIEVASNELDAAILEKGILPMLRGALDKHLARLPSYAMHISVADSPGLSELPYPGHEVPTEAYDALRNLIRQLPGGSIGVSGPRGVGKTTLLRSFCSQEYAPDRSRFRVLVPAPVEYDGRDFVLHLYAAVCREVLEATEDSRISTGRRFWESWNFPQWVGVASAGLGVLVMLSAWLGVGATFVGALVLMVSGIALLRVIKLSNVAAEADLGKRQGEDEHRLYLRRAALQQLRDINFQQSFSMGWSGGLRLPIGADSKFDRSVTLSARPKSYPEIVDSFRRFVTDASTYVPMMIGIDELDKISSDEKAHLFLNDIKAIFGIPRCYYLIAVSDDAIAGFERRGMSFRDVFDSSLDEIVKVGYLDFEGARRLIARRVIGVPVPFVALCYCMSGGLARDLIRAARTLFELGRNFRGSELSVLARLAVHRELRAKTGATMSLLHNLEELQGEMLTMLRSINRLDLSHASAQHLSPSALLEHCDLSLAECSGMAIDEAGSIREEYRTTLRLVRELIGFQYYCATVLEFFNEELDEHRLRTALDNFQGSRSLSVLVSSRQEFASNAWLAWDAVTEFRTAWGLKPLELSM